MSNVDKETIAPVYEAVRNDGDETSWLTVAIDGKTLVLDSSGTDYDEFLSRLTDDECKLAYVRVITGDEMSKRAKFALITWAAPSASVLKKAKLSVYKATLKNVVKSFAVEVHADEKSEVKYDTIREALIKAGGAAYGTGTR